MLYNYCESEFFLLLLQRYMNKRITIFFEFRYAKQNIT
jgi:hypothetical protein